MLGRIAEYELLELIGRGGMGAVFKARDPRLDRVVAVKILPDELGRNAEYRARFLREARAEALLSHPAIATCFDVGEAELDPPDLVDGDAILPPQARKLYLTMEYIPGSDLSSLVCDQPLRIPRVLDLVSQITAGLESAHAAGVIHRDLKPANVRVTPEGRVKILDFGLARISHLKPEDDTKGLSTSESRIMGTWHFMAPEQAHGRTTDPRSDLFSLGVILYQLVTGRLPFTGETHLDVVEAVAHHEPPPMARYASQVPPELERIVQKLLAKDPDHRYQSAHEVRTDLDHLIHSPPAPPAPAPRALVLVFATLVALVGCWWSWKRWGPQPPHAIAVMPFVNRTGDPRLDYLGDGMSAGVLASLVRGAGFNVASASAVHGIAASQRSAEHVARELGVESVLEGSLSSRGELVQLGVELVTGRSGF